MTKAQIVKTEDSIVVSTDKDVFQAHRGTVAYYKVAAMLEDNNYEGLNSIFDVNDKLRNYANGCFAVLDGVMYFKGKAFPTELYKKVMQFVDNDISPIPLIRFWENLMQNPSIESQNDLYGFLNHNGISITNDGCFVCYKRVDDDYTDLRTHKYDNSPGNEVKMPRDEVNHDRNNTCSRGLHGAAYRYAADRYYSGRGRLVEIKINPRDVVAVPPDYNEEKMRVCRYTVVRDCVKEYTKPFYENDESAMDYDDDWQDFDDYEVEDWQCFFQDDWDFQDSWKDCETDEDAENWDNDYENHGGKCDNDAVVSKPLNVDFRNRIRLPKEALDAIGNPSQVYVLTTKNNGQLNMLVYPTDNGCPTDNGLILNNVSIYSPDQYNNLRISLNNWDIKGCKTAYWRYDNDEDRIVISF